ncbi:unnamed protein product, partial [Staurois parvus]
RAPVPPSHTAARSILCHVRLCRLPTLLLGGLFNIGPCMAFNFSCLRSATLPWGPCTASSCCCQARNSAMGPCTDSSCCCQARNLLHGPLCTASSCCCQVQSVSWVPCTASHCCCLHRHTLPCATFRSPHTAGGFHFVI